ncbi:hypothetical protein UMC2_35791 [[Clostridium] sordellii]|uniref:hypothetical protein n=1 Tax=Paraclostridium sordellii TaxID=1505 RepID=UPI0005441ED6|nr:hypothetical protein [Paeniclostridium sordellii]CEK34368.1 hypothetical protein UMC2_35791 [[Clostridium] sordellii] [Paeniclostridium sordellii]
MNKTCMYKGKECNEDKKQTRGEMTKEALKNILAKPEYQTIHDLSLIGIDIFDNEGKFKGAEQITKDIADKINYLINNTCGSSEEDKNKCEPDMEGIIKDGIYMKEIISELKEINNKLIYETGYIAKTGLLTELVNSFGQAITEIDLCIDSLEFLNREFENRIGNITLVISKLEGTVNILDVTKNEKYKYSSINLDEIKINTKEVIKKLKSFNEAWNDTKVETTEINPSVEEDKKENEGNENKKEETSEKDITTPIFKFDDEEMKEKGMYFSGVITPFYGIDFADANKESVSGYIVNPNVTLTVNEVKKYFEEYAEQSKLNVSEAINKPKVELKGRDLTDEAILNENIETMRKEMKEIVSDKLLNIKPMERAGIITKLSKEIRKCINMKNYIEISNRHRSNEDDR